MNVRETASGFGSKKKEDDKNDIMSQVIAKPTQTVKASPYKAPKVMATAPVQAPVQTSQSNGGAMSRMLKNGFKAAQRKLIYATGSKSDIAGYEVNQAWDAYNAVKESDDYKNAKAELDAANTPNYNGVGDFSYIDNNASSKAQSKIDALLAPAWQKVVDAQKNYSVVADDDEVASLKTFDTTPYDFDDPNYQAYQKAMQDLDTVQRTSDAYDEEKKAFIDNEIADGASPEQAERDYALRHEYTDNPYVGELDAARRAAYDAEQALSPKQKEAFGVKEGDTGLLTGERRAPENGDLTGSFNLGRIERAKDLQLIDAMSVSYADVDSSVAQNVIDAWENAPGKYDFAGNWTGDTPIPSEQSMDVIERLFDNDPSNDAYYSNVTDEQKETLLKIIATGNVEDTDRYIQAIFNESQRKQTVLDDAESAEFASNHPVLATLKSISLPTQIGKTIDYFNGMLGSALGHSIATTRYGMSVTRDSQTAVGTIAQNIVLKNPEKFEFAGKEHTTGELLSWLYQNVNSMGESVQRMWFGPLGLILGGGGAGASKLLECYERNCTVGQAVALSMFSFGAEIITEKVSLEALFSMKTGANFGQNLVQTLIQGFTEGSEEVASDLINEFADWFIMQDENQVREQAKAYMAEYPEMSMEDAMWHVLMSGWAESFAGGALSGLVFGAAGQAIQVTERGGWENVDFYQRNFSIDPQQRLQWTKDLQSLGLDPKTTQFFMDFIDSVADDPSILASNAGVSTLNDLANVASDVAGAEAQQADMNAAITEAGASAIYDTALESAQQDAETAVETDRKTNRRPNKGGKKPAQQNVVERQAKLQDDVRAIFTEAHAQAQQITEARLKQEARAQAIAHQKERHASAFKTASEEASAAQASGDTTAQRNAIAKMRDLLTNVQDAIAQQQTQSKLDDLELTKFKETAEAAISKLINHAGEDYAAYKQEAAVTQAQIEQDIMQTAKGENVDAESRIYDESTGTAQPGSEGEVGEGDQQAVREWGNEDKTETSKVVRQFYRITGEEATLKPTSTVSPYTEARAEQFKQKTGRSVAFYTSDNGPDGTNINGNIYVREGASSGVTMFHELAEVLFKADAQFRAEVDNAVANMDSDMIGRFISAYRARDPEFTDRFTDDFIRGEFFADLYGAVNSGDVNIRDLFVTSDEVMNMTDEEIQDLDARINDTVAQFSNLTGYTGENAQAQQSNIDGVGFSATSMKQDKDLLKQDLIDSGIAGDGPDAAMSTSDLNKLFKAIDKVIKVVDANADLLDHSIGVSKESRAFSPYKQNSDPHYKMALDFSTLCRKRILLQSITEDLQGKLKRSLTAEEQVAIRAKLQELQNEGLKVEVACALCYVEAARLKSPKVIKQFLADPGADVKDYFAKKSPTFKQTLEDRKAEWKIANWTEAWGVPQEEAAFATKAQMPGKAATQLNNELKKWRKEYVPTKSEQAIIDKASSMDKSAFLSADSLTQMKNEDPEIYDAFISHVRAASRSKAQETEVAYHRGDIEQVSNALIEEMNKESGFRHQSWSDFEVTHLLDTISAIIELSTKRAKMHAYTKVADMVNLVGDTGMMLNMSLIPAGDTGLDENGNLIWDDVEGFHGRDGRGYDLMLELRDKFHKTAGNIAIGINDDQILALLASDAIDYVIPYHTSGLNKSLRAKMGIKAWKNYTDYQNEKGSGKAPSLSEWFDAEEAKNAEDGIAYMQEASQRYLDLCAERGLIPKFPQFLQDNGDGSYSLRDDAMNYWKLLIDRKMVDQTDNTIISQEAVVPRFDEGRMMDILNDELASPSHQDDITAKNTIEDMIMGGKFTLSKELKTEVERYKERQQKQLLGSVEEQGKSIMDDTLNGVGFSMFSPDDYYTHRGNGYDGYSMSNNARSAYASGEMPMSKWTKSAILDAVADYDSSKVDLLKSVPADVLRENILTDAGWHHTSSMYNRTNFYGIDQDVIDNLTEDAIKEWSKSEKTVSETKSYKGDFEYIEWTGTKSRPKANKHNLTNVNIEERGSFYYVTDDDGNLLIKKKIGSNGTYATDYEAEARRKAEAEAAAKERARKRLEFSTDAAKDFWNEYGDQVEYSQSGNVYPIGRKPSRLTYELGVENFFKVGEKRLSSYWDDEYNTHYKVETWDGAKWIPESEADNGAVFSRNYSEMTPSERDSIAEQTGLKEMGFSMKAPVERTKDLFATHVLTEDSLSKLLKLDSIPAPSIGVVRKGKSGPGNSYFGDITLIFDRKSIDPEIDSRNHIYGADAYTPTINSAGLTSTLNITKNIDDMAREFDPEATDSLKKGLWNAVRNSRSIDEVLVYLEDSKDMISAFAKSLGINVDQENIEEDLQDYFYDDTEEDDEPVSWRERFIDWAVDKLEDAGITESTFTANGDPATGENIVEAMFSRENERLDAFGIDDVDKALGAFLPEYNTIDDVISDSGRLEYDPKRWEKELSYSTSINNELDKIENAITDSVGANITDSGYISFLIAEYLQRNRGKIDPEDMAEYVASYIKSQNRTFEWVKKNDIKDVILDNSDELVRLIEDAMRMPVSYFEAKPRRALDWSEVKKAILPDYISDEIATALEEKGIPISFYESDSETMESRLSDEDVSTYGFSMRAPSTIEDAVLGAEIGNRRKQAALDSTAQARAEQRMLRNQQVAEDMALAGQMSDMRKEAARSRRTQQELQDRLDAQVEQTEQRMLSQDQTALGRQIGDTRTALDRQRRQIENDAMRKMSMAEVRARTEQRDRMNASAKRKDTIEDIRDGVRELYKWRNKPNGKKGQSVPTFLNDFVDKALSSIDLGSESTTYLNGKPKGSKENLAWRDIIRELRTNGDLFERSPQDDRDAFADVEMPDWYKETIAELDKSLSERNVEYVQDMTQDELEQTKAVLGFVKAAVTTANVLHANQRYASIQEAGEALIDLSKQRKAKRASDIGIVNGFDNLVNTDMLSSFDFFRRLGPAGKSIGKSLSKGFEKYFGNVRAIQNETHEAIKTSGVTERELNDWSDYKKSAHEFTLESGETIGLTTGQLMELYALTRRGAAYDHLFGEGIKVKNMPGNQAYQNRTFRVTEGDVDQMLSALTPKQKAFTEKLQTIMSTTLSAMGNEVTQQQYMYDGYNEDYYWTMSVDDNAHDKQEPGKERSFNALINASFTNSLVKSKSALTIGNAIDTFAQHAAQMAAYNGVGLPIQDLLKIENYRTRGENGEKVENRSVQQAITDLVGDKGLSYITTLIKDINGLSSGSTGLEFQKQVMKNVKSTAVSGKLRVVIRQPTAILRAMAMINPAYFAKQGNLAKNIKEMQEKSDLAYWKDQGNFDIGTGRSIYGILFGDKNLQEKVMNTLNAPAGAADNFGWGQIWGAVKAEVTKQHPDVEVGSDEFFDLVNDRFSDVINNTQVIDTLLHRSQIMRSKDGLVKMTTSFMNEPIKTFNMISNAIFDVKNGEPGAKKRLATSLAAVAASTAVDALVTALHDAFKKREPEEPLDDLILENWKSNFADGINPFGMIPYVSQFKSIIDGYKADSLDMGAVEDAVQSIKRVSKWIGDGFKSDTYTTYGMVSTMLENVGNVLGVPMSGMLSSAEAIANTIVPGALTSKKPTKKSQQRVSMVTDAGVDKKAAKHFMSDYSGNDTNAVNAFKILSYDDDKNGEPDWNKDQQAMIASILGIDTKGEDLTDYAEDAAVKYLKGRRTALRKTDSKDEYEEKYNIYEDYFEMLGLDPAVLPKWED